MRLRVEAAEDGNVESYLAVLTIWDADDNSRHRVYVSEQLERGVPLRLAEDHFYEAQIVPIPEDESDPMKLEIQVQFDRETAVDDTYSHRVQPASQRFSLIRVLAQEAEIDQ